MLADLFSVEGSLSGLQVAPFLLCPHVALECVQREGEYFLMSLLRTLILWGQNYTVKTLFYTKGLLKGPPVIHSHSGN